MTSTQYATFNAGNPFSIKMVGSNSFVREQIDTLVLDFEAPHYGYNGEFYDEYDVYEMSED